MNFQKIIKKWEENGLITEAQSQKMLLDIKQEESEHKSSKLISIVSTIGGLLLGLGAILFIASNWDQIPRFLKLFSAVLLPVVPLVVAYVLIFIKKTHQKLGYAFVLLGALLIGASIAIIGQVYNTDANPRALFGLWSILSIPLIYIFNSRLSAFVSSILVTILIFFLIVGDRFNDDLIAYIPFIYIGYGLLLFLFSEWHKNYFKKVYARIAKVFEFVAVKIILIASFVLTLGFFNEEAARDNSFLFGDFQRFLYNIAFVALLALLFWIGNKRGDKILINSTFFWTGIFIIFRYFDFFWDMFDVSLFFMGGGVLLVFLSIFLEKRRRKLLASFKKI